MHFTKMHGLGNDYLYVYGEVPENLEELSVRLSERHFGAGSDGMIYISPSRIADFKMRIFNADGSEAKMCGNGIRCVGKYVYDKRNAKCIMSALDELGIWYTGGKNAPYIWMKCPDNMGSWEFFDLLLNEIQVVGTPGEGFGKCGEGYFRLSTFGSIEDTEEAARRLKELLGNKNEKL